MEADRVRGNRDNPRFRLSLGLTSVRHMVDRLEAEYTQATGTNGSTLEVVRYDPDVEDSYIGYDDFPFSPPNGQVWNKFAVNFGVALSKCIPSVTLANFGVLSVATAVFAPRMISYLVLYPFCRLVFGTLYPAYASYKAVRTKNLKEYVKWMMYWIVFALFTCTETFTDVFLSWFPFYYEVKIVLVLWLLSPATKGSSILYRKFVHPALCRREQEIDEYIAKAKDQGYHTVLNLGTKGVNYATTVIMQTAIKGGGGLVQQLRKSYSLSDLTECEPIEERGADEADDVLAEPRLIRRALKSGFAARRSASESNSRQPMYFPEVDVDVRSTRSGRSDEPDFSHIKSTEDISSGYSSADNSAPLTRTGSVGAAGAAGRGGRARTTRAAALTAIKRPPAAEDNEVLIEELQDDDSINCANMPSLINISSHLYLSHTNPPFIYQYVGDQVKIIQVLGQMPLYNEIKFNSYQSNHQDNKEMFTENRIEREHIIATTSQNNSNDITANNKEYTSNDLVIEEAYSSKNKSSSPKIVGVLIDSTIPDKDANDKNDNEFKKSNENNVAYVSDNLATNSSAEPLTDYYSSDDEASFGTPSDSPKMIRKNQKGKYGKNKAPLPPKIDFVKTVDSDDTDSKEITMNIDSKLKELDKQKYNNQTDLTVCRLETLNPVSEINRHQKSKSPSRIPKPSALGLGKLLQLPSKLTFWHKFEDKSISDNNSVSSDDKSRRGSVENPSFYRNEDAYAPLNETNDITEIPLRKNSKDFEDGQEFDTENTTQNIVEKSDVLQKLIEAKIESHPEYKYVPLNDEILTTSISTDV